MNPHAPEPVLWIDGQWKTKETGTVSVYDHGLLYGDGIFEGMRIYAGKVFRLKDHLVRLEESAQALLLSLPYPRAEIEAVLVEAVARWGRPEGYIRLVVTRGVGTLGLDPNRCPRASLIVIVDGIQLYPAELYATGIPLVTASTRRTPRSSAEARVKSLNYLNNILAKMEAHRAGCLEALMLNTEGLVAECTADNVFLVKNGVLKTPAAVHGALEGITRKVVLELASGLGIPDSGDGAGTVRLLHRRRSVHDRQRRRGDAHHQPRRENHRNRKARPRHRSASGRLPAADGGVGRDRFVRPLINSSRQPNNRLTPGEQPPSPRSPPHEKNDSVGGCPDPAVGHRRLRPVEGPR